MLSVTRCIVRICALTIVAATSKQVFASGSYTSPGSRALADANAAGDSLLAGDNKILLIKEGSVAGRTLQRQFPAEPGVVTGGVFERQVSPETLLSARICSQTQSVGLHFSSDGQSNTNSLDLSEILALKGPRELRCAILNATGQWLALNIKNGRGAVFASPSSSQNRRIDFQLPKISGAWSHVVSLNEKFLVFGEGGEGMLIDPTAQSGVLVSPVRAPWNDLGNRDALASRGSRLLRAGEGTVSLHEAQIDNGNLVWSPVAKINISPCSDNGGCGAWLSPEGRWVVSGAWGTFTGTAGEFVRLKVPLVVNDATSPGIAINVRQQKYLLVGDIDSDVGSLPDELLKTSPAADDQELSRETRGKRTGRFIVWLKGRVANLRSNFAANEDLPRPLFSYVPHASKEAPLGDVIVVGGRIPNKLPAHWAAVEPEVQFAPISMATEWSPRLSNNRLQPPAQPWWVEAAKFKQALQALRQVKVQPQNIRVAVIDSGVDVAHPALENSFDMNEKEVPNNGIDDDANGLVDDIIGYDFSAEKPTPEDQFGHGTHVAGLLTNSWSSEGSLGGAFNARLRIFRALDSKGRSNSVDLARAISAAIETGADVMNCSWGGGPETQVLKDAFAAASASGMLIFSSAGNDGLNSDKFPQVPKKFPGVFSIGAATQNQTRARFSNWGSSSVFLFAPGQDILSSIPTSAFGEKSGTSMASPIAASVGSLVLGTLKTLHPEWSREQQVKATADFLCLSSEKNRLAQANSKCGSLNALRAVQAGLGAVP